MNNISHIWRKYTHISRFLPHANFVDSIHYSHPLLSRIWTSRSNFVGKCMDKGLNEIPYLLLLVDWQFWLFHVRILNAFKCIIFSNHGGPFKCIPNHFRQEFNSTLPPREPLLFGTVLRAIVPDIDKTSYSLSPDFTIKWNHVSDSCLRKAENLYIFVRFPYFYENIPYFDCPYSHISLKICSMMPVYLTS